MRANSFGFLADLCATKGIICEKTRGKIELTTPDGSVTAECLTLAEAFVEYQSEPFLSLPIKLAKTGWQRQMGTEAKKEGIRVDALDHLRAIAAGLRDCDKGNGDRLIADNILKRVQSLESELKLLGGVVVAAREVLHGAIPSRRDFAITAYAKGLLERSLAELDRGPK